jgi:hypothetical protein
VNGLWSDIQSRNAQTCTEQFDSGPDGSKHARDTIKAVSQTHSWFPFDDVSNPAHSSNETLRHKTSTTVMTAHCTEFRILPWNPIVAVPTRQTIIRAVSARRPHPCTLASQQHIVLLSPLQPWQGQVSWTGYNSQHTNYHSGWQLTEHAEGGRGVFGFTLHTRACTVWQTACY